MGDEIFIRRLTDCEEFIAGDGCRLRELFHPEKTPWSLGYSLAHAIVSPGQTTARHRLKQASEVYFILEGEGEMHIDNQSAAVGPGDAIYIAPGSWQYIRNSGSSDLVFVCMVDPGWQPEDEEVQG